MSLHMGTHFNDVEQILNEPSFMDRGGRRSPYPAGRLVYEQEQTLSNGYGPRPVSRNKYDDRNNQTTTTTSEYNVKTEKSFVTRSYPSSTVNGGLGIGYDASDGRRLQQASPASVHSAPVIEQNRLDYTSTGGSGPGVTTIPKGNCATCLNPINGQVVIALGHVWHPEHFTCAKCKDELGHRNFYERNGRVYCENDFFNSFAPQCAYCNGPIKDRCLNAIDKTWHPEHFTCTVCGKSFENEGFHEKDGQAFCKKDYFALFAPPCRGCKRPISDNFVKAFKGYWHRDCFICTTCKRPFDGGQFYELNGEPYCETHYHEKRGSVCDACRKPLIGKRVNAMGKKFHPEHFVCTICKSQLHRDNFKEHQKRAYCQKCFGKNQF